MKAMQKHLEGVTKESYMNWRSNHAFNTYASATSKIGLVELGVDGNGNAAIRIKHKTGSDTYFYNNSAKAVKAYGEFLNQV